jgi:hypothetical protein
MPDTGTYTSTLSHSVAGLPKKSEVYCIYYVCPSHARLKVRDSLRRAGYRISRVTGAVCFTMDVMVPQGGESRCGMSSGHRTVRWICAAGLGRPTCKRCGLVPSGWTTCAARRYQLCAAGMGTSGAWPGRVRDQRQNMQINTHEKIGCTKGWPGPAGWAPSDAMPRWWPKLSPGLNLCCRRGLRLPGPLLALKLNYSVHLGTDLRLQDAACVTLVETLLCLEPQELPAVSTWVPPSAHY